MISDIENEIESLHPQECPLKSTFVWKLVTSLEALFFNVTVFIYSIMEL